MLTIKTRNLTIHCDGPENDVFTFQMIIAPHDGQNGLERFYRRGPKGWTILSIETGTWENIPPVLVPIEIKQARVQYGMGEIRQGRFHGSRN